MADKTVLATLGKAGLHDEGVWDSATAYEPLAIVRSGGKLYASRKSVPAGTALSDGEHWCEYADFDALWADMRESLQADYDAAKATWQRGVDSLLATGGTYEARISALEAIENTREMTYEQIQAVVRAGVSSRYFKVGDQILVPWTDTASGTQYTIPFDVVHHADGSDDDHAKVTLADGSEVCGMYLQAHYALPFGTSFSDREPFYIVPDGGMPAGTYNIRFGESCGTNVVAGKTYQFTVDEDIPAGYQLLGFYGAPDQAPSNWMVYVFDTAYNRTPLKTYTVSEGSGGTSLGEFRNAAVNGSINALHRVAYGYNNWSRSALRQWLNSSSDKGTWWEPQHEWDHAPINADYSAVKDGFLKGFTDGFLDILGTVRVQTVGNNNTDAAELFTTNDVFFPPSARQHYFNNYLFESSSGYTASGQPWDYWKELAAANGRTSPWPGWNTYPELITYDLAGNHTNACYVWLRSADCSTAPHAGYVTSSGAVHNYAAYYAHRCAPACVIC